MLVLTAGLLTWTHLPNAGIHPQMLLLLLLKKENMRVATRTRLRYLRESGLRLDLGYEYGILTVYDSEEIFLSIPPPNFHPNNSDFFFFLS